MLTRNIKRIYHIATIVRVFQIVQRNYNECPKNFLNSIHYHVHMKYNSHLMYYNETIIQFMVEHVVIIIIVCDIIMLG